MPQWCACPNPLGSYVAMTRVTRRDKLLIYRPFARDLFSQGVREGPDLLLEHLRGNGLDWAAIEAKYTPNKRCSECHFVHFKEKFQPMQWNRADKLSVCKACIDMKKQSGTPFRCNNCGLWKGEASFTSGQQHGMSLLTRVCVDCIEQRQCGECKEYKSEDHFRTGEWVKAGKLSTQGKCKKCMARNRELKACSGPCGLELPQSAFTTRMWDIPPHKCRACMRGKESSKECAGPCGQLLPLAAYSARMWKEDDKMRKCLKCATKSARGFWVCIQCKSSKVKNEFSEWLTPRARKVNNGTARCNECTLSQRASQMTSLKASLAHISKRNS